MGTDTVHTLPVCSFLQTWPKNKWQGSSSATTVACARQVLHDTSLALNIITDHCPEWMKKQLHATNGFESCPLSLFLLFFLLFPSCLVCVFGVCVLRHGEKTWKNPCVDSKNASVCTFKTSPVYAGTTRTCVETCARGAGTHGDVFERTHGDVLNPHTGSRGSSSVLLTKICPRTVITCFRGSPKKLLDLSHFQV